MAAGPDPDTPVAAIRPFVEAGYDEVHNGNIGPNWECSMRLYRDDVLPRLRQA